MEQNKSDTIISISTVSKTYGSGFTALRDINLDIRRGEIFALLGPNGAGKTTLISIICGLVNLSQGAVTVNGYDIVNDYKKARSYIGLVPQELTTDAFETVLNTVAFSRGLFGKSKNPAHLEKVLKSLSLWDKRNNRLFTLSGGMKRRVMIAKALSHEPEILFLDEPTAGVDVELRKEMWQLVRSLKDTGVTIILTTHYIEEAEEMADRIGIINNGSLLLVEQKQHLMRQLGQKTLTIKLAQPLSALPDRLHDWPVKLIANGNALHFCYEHHDDGQRITELLAALQSEGLEITDLDTAQRSLEEIFIDLIHSRT